MNDVRCYLLTAIGSGKRYPDELLDNSPASCADTVAVLRSLKHEHLVRFVDIHGPYSLTSKGRELRFQILSSLEENQHDKNDEDVQGVHPDFVPESKQDFREKFKDSVLDAFVSSGIGKLFELLNALLKFIIKLLLLFKP